MYQQVGPREAQILPKDSHPTEKSKFRRKKAKVNRPFFHVTRCTYPQGHVLRPGAWALSYSFA